MDVKPAATFRGTAGRRRKRELGYVAEDVPDGLSLEGRAAQVLPDALLIADRAEVALCAGELGYGGELGEAAGAQAVAAAATG